MLIRSRPSNGFITRPALPAQLAAWMHLVSLLLSARGGLAAETNSPFAKWEKEIAAFEASDKSNPPPKDVIVFVGSSSIRMWKNLARDFPDRAVINRGFGGSQIIDSVHFADRIVIPYSPRQIVMYAGGNDINAGKSADEIFADFKAFVARIQAALPETRIAYISSAPNPARWAQVERVRRLNQLIEQFTKTDSHLDFINVFPRMLGPDGQPKPNIFLPDRLHMNENGYAIWRDVVGGHLLNVPAAKQ
jgi:lysophospholipase L1-like esterase